MLPLPRVRALSSSRSFSPSSFSSLSPKAGGVGDFVIFSSSAVRNGEIPVLRRALLTKPPPTLRAKNLPRNLCGFIGSVVSPLRRYMNVKRFGVFTWLEVKSHPSISSDHSSSFQILVGIWDELGEMAFRHLWQDDLIYVWGPLESYVKVDENGKHRVFHKLIAKNLNYVRKNAGSQVSPCAENLDELKGKDSSYYDRQDYERQSRERLHLWQVFFANPHEWWDNRKSKRNSWSPDFRHKDTHECLARNPDDPPWVRNQLKLYDLKMSDMSLGNRDGCLTGLPLYD